MVVNILRYYCMRVFLTLMALKQLWSHIDTHNVIKHTATAILVAYCLVLPFRERFLYGLVKNI